MNPTTPAAINENVLRLKAKLGLNTEPVFVPVCDASEFKAGHCFNNVRLKIQRDGGSLQHGWIVWESPKTIVEGEFHAVWVNPAGEYVDVTPKVDGETQILFIPDPNQIYQNVPVDNVRVLLTDEPSFVQSVQMVEKLAQLRIKYYVEGEGARIPPEELASLGIMTRNHANETTRCWRN